MTGRRTNCEQDAALIVAAFQLDRIDEEPRYVRSDQGSFQPAPSRIWSDYMRAYRNWVEAVRGN